MRYFHAPFLMTVGILIAISGRCGTRIGGGTPARTQGRLRLYRLAQRRRGGDPALQGVVGPAEFRRGALGRERPNTGHHHLLIDTDLPPLDEPIPNDKKHIHLGAGQTETYVELPPGRHTIQLLMGDYDHVPHDPPVMSKKITVIVR